MYEKEEKSKEISNYIPSRALPSKFSWVNKSSPAKHQSTCGGCWAFAAAGVFETIINIEDGVMRDISEQYFINCDRNPNQLGCLGGMFPSAFLQKEAMVYEGDEPYVNKTENCKASYPKHEKAKSTGIVPEAKIGSDLKSSTAINAIKTAMLKYGPIWATVHVDTGVFYKYKKGEVITQSKDAQVNHAIILSGWDDSQNCWIVKNSWSEKWGDNGYCKVAYGVGRIGSAASYIVYKGTITSKTNYKQMDEDSYIISYPNPNNGLFSIQGLNNGDMINFYNILGEQVTTILSHNEIQEINLTNIVAKGVYFYKVFDSTFKTIKAQGKIVIQ